MTRCAVPLTLKSRVFRPLVQGSPVGRTYHYANHNLVVASDPFPVGLARPRPADDPKTQLQPELHPRTISNDDRSHKRLGQTGWGRRTSMHREVLIEADPLPVRLLRSRSHENAIPHDLCEWYVIVMSGTYQVAMGDRGRLVIPADLRERAGLAEGTALILLETPRGLVLLTRPQLQELVQADLTGLDLVGELLAERRISATTEDAA